MVERADVRLVGLRLVVARPSCSCRSPRSGFSSSSSSASSPGRSTSSSTVTAVKPKLIWLFGQSFAYAALVPMLRDPRRDRGRVRRPRDRERTRARPGTRRHRRPDDPARALPRLLGRDRQEAERGAAAPRDRRDHPVRRRALAARERRLEGACVAALDGAAALCGRRDRPLRDRPPLRARPCDLRQRPRPPRNGVRRRARPLPPLGHGAPRDCSAASSTGGRRSSVGCSARRLTRWSAILLFVGFNCTFFVQFLLGDQGQARGASSFSAHGSTAAYNMISTIGAFVDGPRRRALPPRRCSARRAAGGPATILGSADTLEWYTTSPPPPHNFDSLPPVTSARPLSDLREALQEPSMRSESPERSPGPFLRGAIVAAAAATAAVVVSATLDSARGHWAAALVAVPLLVAAVVIARLAYPRLLRGHGYRSRSSPARDRDRRPRRLERRRRLGDRRPRRRRGGSLAASLVALVLSFRGEPLPLGPWRDYITLTKPRIMSLLLLTGAAGMFVGAGGWPNGWEFLAMMVGLALACGGSSALNHVMDADIDKLMGERTAARPGRVGPRRRAPGARVRGRPDGALVRAARDDRERPHRSSRARRRPLLRRRLHRLPEALDRPEHRHRRGRRSGAAARRLRRRDRESHASRPLAVPDRLPLDAAAFLGARADDQGALRRSRAFRCCRARGATARRPGRSCSTPSCSSPSRSPWASGSAPSTRSRRVLLGAYFLLLAWQLRRDTSRRRAVVLFHYSLAYLALLFVAAAVDPLLV